MPTLHIFRGLPGSGKSTAARKLAEETGAILIEPDALLVEDGVYRYTPERYKSAVGIAQGLTNIAACMECDIIYADALPKMRDIWGVKKCVEPTRHPYQLKVHDLKITAEESKLRNRHNVRTEDIDRMAQEWEDWE